MLPLPLPLVTACISRECFKNCFKSAPACVFCPEELLLRWDVRVCVFVYGIVPVYV